MVVVRERLDRRAGRQGAELARLDLLGLDGEDLRAHAACRGYGADLLHDVDRTDEAPAVCRRCSVTAECRSYGRRFPAVVGAVYGGRVTGVVRVQREKEPSDPAEVWRRVGAIAAHTG